MEELDTYLAGHSYLGSVTSVTLVDFQHCEGIKEGSFDHAALPHLSRWYRHVSSLKSRHAKFDHFGIAIPDGTKPVLGVAVSSQTNASKRKDDGMKQVVGSQGAEKQATTSIGIASHSKKAAKERARELSQTLSMLLRHQAQEKGLPIDACGWVNMEHALAHINSFEGDDALEGGFLATAEEVREVALSSDKQRFGLRGPPHNSKALVEQIRANQGHTMKGINPDFAPICVSDLPLALHGTYKNTWEIIKREGLSRMDRNYVHLAKDLPGESGVISGMRASCEVLIWVDVAAAQRAGLSFGESENGVVLTEGPIPPSCFSKVILRSTGEELS
jgi:2'-phosphotransferase